MNILINEVENRLNLKKQKQLRKEKRATRKRKPKAQPFYRDMVQDLFLVIKGKSYLSARIRCAYTIFTITGIRCEELRTLKNKQVQSLFTNHYVAITRKKRGPANKKAFLRKCGAQFLIDNKEDFDLLIARKAEMLSEKYDDENTIDTAIQESFLFSSESKPESPLSRAYFNNMLNKTLLTFKKKFNIETKYTTHSFRHYFITELWKDSGDIEYVRQVMGHKFIASTVAYIENLLDAEHITKLAKSYNQKVIREK
jgi:integrase